MSGLINPKIIGNLIHEAKDKTFHNMIEKAKTIEQLNIDVADMKPLNKTYSQNMIKKSSMNKSNGAKGGNKTKVSQTYKCCRCGKSGSHLAHECFALKLTCTKCQKLGHLSKVCRTKTSPDSSKTTLNYVSDDKDYSKYFSIFLLHIHNAHCTCSATQSIIILLPNLNSPQL